GGAPRSLAPLESDRARRGPRDWPRRRQSTSARALPAASVLVRVGYSGPRPTTPEAERAPHDDPGSRTRTTTYRASDRRPATRPGRAHDGPVSPAAGAPSPYR